MTQGPHMEKRNHLNLPKGVLLMIYFPVGMMSLGFHQQCCRWDSPRDRLWYGIRHAQKYMKCPWGQHQWKEGEGQKKTSTWHQQLPWPTDTVLWHWSDTSPLPWGEPRWPCLFISHQISHWMWFARGNEWAQARWISAAEMIPEEARAIYSLYSQNWTGPSLKRNLSHVSQLPVLPGWCTLHSQWILRHHHGAASGQINHPEQNVDSYKVSCLPLYSFAVLFAFAFKVFLELTIKNAVLTRCVIPVTWEA